VIDEVGMALSVAHLRESDESHMHRGLRRRPGVPVQDILF